MSKGRRLKTAFAGFFLSGAMMGLLPCANAAPAEGGTVRFGVEALVPPFESRNAKGELIGLNIELGEALCAELKAKCEWVDQDYATMIAALLEQRFDAIMPMTATEERRKTLEFTDVLYLLKSQLVAPTRSGLLPGIESLKGKRVGVLAGTVREAFALAEWAPAGVEIIGYKLNDELIRALLAGEIDASLQDSIEITEALLKTPQGAGFELAGPAISDPRLGSGVSIGVRQTDASLRDGLNQALKTLKANGQYQAILDRYIPVSGPLAQRDSMQFIPAGPKLPFSTAVRVGPMLYLSGVLGSDDSGKLVPGGIRGEMQQVMKLIGQTLERNGSSLSHVAKCTVILADIKDFAAMNEVYASAFTADRLPARTTFQAAKLLDKARVEVECVAVTAA